MAGSEIATWKPSMNKVADELPGAEGPVFDNKGNFYMVAPEKQVDGKDAGEILKIDLPNQNVSILCAPKSEDGHGGIPAGCQADKEGNFYVADMRLGILFVKPNGEYQQLAFMDSSGRKMQGCNDCCLDYEGNLWVTAPAGEIAPSSYKRSFEEAFGSFYCLTKDQKIILVDTGYRFPNGIAVIHSKEGKPQKVIVAETPTRSLWSFDIVSAGKVMNKTLWGKLPDCDCEGGPDGMDFDEQGNLLVAHWGSGYIEVFPPSGGKPIMRIQCPFDKPSNLHFQPGTNKVFVTEHTSHGLWHFEWRCKGMAQFCDL